MKSKTIFGLFALAIVTFGIAAMQSQKVQAHSHKITICHATDSQSNPYVVIPVSKSSVDEPKNTRFNGHGDHEGPVWQADIADHSWGDIIPAFDYKKANGSTATYGGYNWDAAGQAIYYNGCAPVGKQIRASINVEVEAATCESPEIIASITLLNAVLENNSAVEGSTGPGSFTVKAKATGEALFSNGNKNWSQIYVLDGPLTGEDCEEEVTEADITAKLVCATVDGQPKIELTLTNDSDTEGDVTVNGENVSVGNEPVVMHFTSGTKVAVVINGETVIDRSLICVIGMGSVKPDPKTSDTPKVPQVAELPYTGASVTPLVAAGALSLAGIILAAGSAIKSRLLA